MAIHDNDLYECANDDCVKLFRHKELVEVSKEVRRGFTTTVMGCPHCKCKDFYIVESASDDE